MSNRSMRFAAAAAAALIPLTGCATPTDPAQNLATFLADFARQIAAAWLF